MSTRSSRFYYSSDDSKNEVHLYREMLDGLTHLEMTDNGTFELNITLPDHLVALLLKVLVDPSLREERPPAT